MKWIGWQMVCIILVICLSITAIELFAISKGMNGTALSLSIGGLVGIPSVILIKKKSDRVD